MVANILALFLTSEFEIYAYVFAFAFMFKYQSTQSIFKNIVRCGNSTQFFLHIDIFSNTLF